MTVTAGLGFSTGFWTAGLGVSATARGGSAGFGLGLIATGGLGRGGGAGGSTAAGGCTGAASGSGVGSDCGGCVAHACSTSIASRRDFFTTCSSTPGSRQIPALDQKRAYRGIC